MPLMSPGKGAHMDRISLPFPEYADYAREAWARSMEQSEHFSLERCTKEEKISVWDRMAPSYDAGLGTDPRRVNLALARLCELGALPADSALDIGSGTGAYTLPLAAHCKTVCALDNSSGMQQVLRQKAEQQGISNIVPLNEDWRALDAASLPHTYDLVLSSLNTGICDA